MSSRLWPAIASVGVERVLVRDRPLMLLRVELGPCARGSAVPAHATVEWAGRVGHPSSYALLTGTRSGTAGIALLDSGDTYRSPLVRRGDNLRWGLPAEYETAVADVLEHEPQAVVVSHAGHGQIGSSQIAFRGVARLLCRVLAGGLPSEDEAVWRLRDRCWQDG